MGRALRVSWVVLTVGVALLAGCATTPSSAPPAAALPETPVRDVKDLAGEWVGSAVSIPGGSFEGRRVDGRISIKEDGTFASNIGGAPGTGVFRIADGKIVYEGSAMRGTAALYGSGAQAVMKGEGTLVGVDGRGRFEVRRR
jgi:hypothetical protein